MLQQNKTKIFIKGKQGSIEICNSEKLNAVRERIFTWKCKAESQNQDISQSFSLRRPLIVKMICVLAFSTEKKMLYQQNSKDINFYVTLRVKNNLWKLIYAKSSY